MPGPRGRIPDFDPPPEVLNRRPRKESVKDRPLPPPPTRQEQERQERLSHSSPPVSSSHRDGSGDYNVLGGYRRENPQRQDSRRYNPGWHNQQFEVPRYQQSRREDTRPSRPYVDEKFGRDSPHNFHHNPPHYKHSVRKDKRYSREHGDGGCRNPLTSCSNAIVHVLEEAFYKLGYAVGRYPPVFIVVSVAITLACGSGVIRLEQETDGTKLWVPSGSLAQDDRRLADKYFPSNIFRFNTLIVTADNVLSPSSLKSMAALHKKILEINKDDEDGNLDVVCEKLGNNCWMRGVLELWNFDDNVINSLTMPQIIDKINATTTSPVFGFDFDITKFISNIKRDASGKIMGAEAAQMQYVLRFEDDTIVNGTRLDQPIQDWEMGFLEVGEKGHEDLTVYRYAFRSRQDEAGGAIFGDTILLSSGYGVVIVFVIFVLGRFNRIEHKIFISLTGIMCVFFALAMSIGIGSYAKLVYSPLNSILPFLILGLGVDDMFVTVSALDNLSPEEKKLPVAERMGHTLKSAGVSITVTSLTDMLAFGVGISTSLPALRSFCTYCLMAIFFTFVFQCTFFLAWLSVDERRADAHRDACFCCLRLRTWTPNSCSQILFIKSFFRKVWSRLMTNIVMKVVVLLATAGLLAFGIYGTIHIEQDSDWTAFIPGDSYARTYLDKSAEYFPSNRDGIPTSVFLVEVDYYKDYPTLEKLHKQLEEDPYTEDGTVRSWWYSYRAWLNNTNDNSVISRTDSDRFPNSEDEFYDILLTKYLTSPQGRSFKNDIVLTAEGNRIAASRNSLRHDNLVNTVEQVKAMESIRGVVAAAGFGRNKAFAYTRRYLTYEGNKAIQTELYRNLGLAFLCVAVMTLILIANFVTSGFICMCVIMTVVTMAMNMIRAFHSIVLYNSVCSSDNRESRYFIVAYIMPFSVVDVGGMMYFWNLTIDTVTSIILILAMGLSIDFAAHIGHMFMNVRGKRNERVQRTLVLMGPAVFSGGFSTFLAFILLVFSKSYVFKTFFKVFLGVVVFGLFHGLAFLPVILSILGPMPYETAHHDSEEHESEDRGRDPWYDSEPRDGFSYRRSHSDRHRSPAQSSLESAGQLQRREQRHYGRDARPISRQEEAARQGYIPRGTAYSSRRYQGDRGGHSLNSSPGFIYGVNMPRGYVKPAAYSKPAAYKKPQHETYPSTPWPAQHRRY